ncbi:MAG: polyprenyl synthetase [Planctomycetia bacterium 21-64-5]|nr:MAG: polyprenyl synthetase [Planctomycetia bacterium 21-64-5]HQU42900.1 polyprenyl synthetase family protein [Pirellulales bacterium]
MPETRELRETIRARCGEVAARLDKSRPLGKDELEALARGLLDESGWPEGFLGWTMVGLATQFWSAQVAAVPFERRLFLLPHCLKHAEGCPADYDEFGLDCRKCGACRIADFRTRAEELGYKVLVAEGSPIVLKIIVSGYVDAIVGVACLNVLEKAIDKILLAGIPCLAVPLLSSDCRNTSVDEDWVMDIINLRHEPPPVLTRSYVHLMRAASGLFEPAELERLSPRLRGGPTLAQLNGQGVSGLDPVAGTEAIAYDFLAKGGKHSRPFITLAVYDALTGGNGTTSDGAAHLATVPDWVKRAAVSIETFHKASLVHDDIEDDDPYRYGEATLHRRFGIPTAINVGDYLIGMGYRLISRDAAHTGPEVAADIVDRLADAHLKLSEGQGAELLWRDSLQKRLTPLDALKIYALKTAPAFEAALFSGLRMAGPGDAAAWVGQFARNLGVAFQILNDLNDWRGDDHNKLLAAGDILGGRPTVLWALALEGLDDAGRAELEALVGAQDAGQAAVHRVRQLYTSAGVFEKAERLVDKYQQRAEAVADEVGIDELRRLLYYLVDTVLERPSAAEPDVMMPTLSIAVS